MARKAKALDPASFAKSLDADPSDDYEIAECWTIIASDASEVTEKNSARIKLNRLVLGGRFDEVMASIREANGGKLPIASVNQFVMEVIGESARLKNSEASASD